METAPGSLQDQSPFGPDSDASPSSASFSRSDSIQAREARSSLKQADLDRKYKDEIKWMQKEIDHWKFELECSRNKKSAVEEELNSMREEYNRWKIGIERLRSENADLQSRFQRHDGGTSALKEKIATLQEQLRGLPAKDAEIDNLRNQCAHSEAELAQLNQELQAVRAEKANAVDAGKHLGEEVLQLQAQVLDQNGALKQANTQISDLEKARVAAEAGLATSKGAAAVLQQLLDGAQAHSENITAELKSVMAESERLKEEYANHSQVVSELRQSVAAAEEEAASLRQSAQRDAAAARAAEQKAADAMQRAEAAGAELDDMRRKEESRDVSMLRLNELHERDAQELRELQTEYNKFKFDYARTKVEMHAMVGRLVKILKELEEAKSAPVEGDGDGAGHAVGGGSGATAPGQWQGRQAFSAALYRQLRAVIKASQVEGVDAATRKGGAAATAVAATLGTGASAEAPSTPTATSAGSVPSSPFSSAVSRTDSNVSTTVAV